MVPCEQLQVRHYRHLVCNHMQLYICCSYLQMLKKKNLPRWFSQLVS